MKTSILLSSVLLGATLFAFKDFQSFSCKSNAAVVSTLVHKHRNKSNFLPVGTVSIVIDKSDYELNVYDEQGWYATYPVVFGNNSQDDKKMEGDRQTPEGTFRIVSKRVHDKWNRYMALDYPNKESYEKFNKRKQRGEIPPSARIGGGIGIHGTWPHDDFMIDRYSNWTMGCISMKNSDVEEVYSFVPVGTRITIRK
jgi:murein L,D-transpeptidase YafK